MDSNHPRIFGSSRMIIAIVGMFGFINMYAMRVNMSVAIVCMTDQFVRTPFSDLPKNVSLKNFTETTSQSSECNNTNAGGQEVLHLRHGEFPWSKQTQGLILGSFFYGYLITQIPGGYLAHHFGGKRVLGLSMLICAIATLLMPLAARYHHYALMVLRLIAGLCQGVVFPCMHSIWSRWAPPWERSTLISITFSGCQLGSVFSLSISGLLCEYGFNGGWPSIFYLLGTLGILWFVAWMYFVYDSPRQHPRVTKREKNYIESSLADQLNNDKDKRPPIPWCSFITSPAVWAIFVTHICSNVGIYTFLTNIPTYLAEVLELDLKSNGVISSLPYVGFWFFMTISGPITDALVHHHIVQIGGARKFSNSIGFFAPAVLVILLSFVGCGQTYRAIVFLTVAVALCGFQSSGFLVNHADIAPSYAGLLFGIGNTFATIPGFGSPAVIGALTKNKLRSEWKLVFYIVAGVYVFGGLVFCFFAKGKVQPWAVVKPKEVKEEPIKKALEEKNKMPSEHTKL